MPITIARIVAITGVILAGVLIVIAHRRRPELRASEIALSVYFTDPTRATMTSAYAAIMAALFSTAFALATDMHVAALVTAVACCVGAVLLVPVVATTQRNATIVRSETIKRVHRYAAAAAFVAVGVAMAVSACAAITEANVPVVIFGFFGAALVILVLRSKPGAAHGLRQKILLATLGLWIVVIAIAG
jgi:Sec-independent protein secretion pathway component TatC